MDNKTMMQSLKRSGQLMLNEVDGVMWATNSHWTCPVPDAKHPLARLLADYNLTLAPCVCRVGATIKKNAVDVAPGIATIVSSLRQDSANVIERVELAGLPVTVWAGAEAALFRHPSGYYMALATEYLRLLDHIAPSSEPWHAKSRTDPAVQFSDGKPTTVLMPIRVEGMWK